MKQPAKEPAEKPFVPVRFAVLAVSDSRSLDDDRSGATLAERIEGAGHILADRAIVTDDAGKIRKVVKRWLKDPEVDVVITTGGTGFTGRDVTPDAVEPLFEKRMEGFAAVFHRISYDKIGTATMQSRATAGAGEGQVRLLPAGLNRRLQGRLGRHPRPPVRLPAGALQLRGNHAAPRRAPEAREAAEKDREEEGRRSDGLAAR